MHLKAISVGDAVPRTDFTATVHSVFESAINLRLDKADYLLTVLASSEADLPQGIRVDAPVLFETFHAGESVTCQDANLRLDSLTIDLGGARRWKCDLPALKADLAKPAVSASWKFVWNALNNRQKFSNAEIIVEDLFRSDESTRTNISRRASEAMRDLVNVTRRCELTGATAVNALIGLGSGLTPSGDDLLIGYLAGLWCAVQDKHERIQFVSDLGEAMTHYSRQTNDISRTYLYHASRGQVSSLLAHLAEAICRGENPERLLEIASPAMQVGHTSGMDAVAGLLIGLVAGMSPGPLLFPIGLSQ